MPQLLDAPVDFATSKLPQVMGQKGKVFRPKYMPLMNGGTALMLAASMGHASVARELVMAGANPEASIMVHGKKVSALSIAEESGSTLLLTAMSR